MASKDRMPAESLLRTVHSARCAVPMFASPAETRLPGPPGGQPGPWVKHRSLHSGTWGAVGVRETEGSVGMGRREQHVLTS